MVRKFLFSLIVCLPFIQWGCQDIPRDNVLDPRNPDSYSPSVVLVEAFVNTTHPSEFNPWALQALGRLNETYGNEVIVVEYHRDLPDFPDPWSNSVYNSLYETYLDALPGAVKGIPDIFIDGISGRVQGASNVDNVLNRLTSQLSHKVTRENYFTIKPGDLRITSATMIPSCKIARLGNNSISNIMVKLLLLTSETPGQSPRIAMDLKKSTKIPLLEPGEIREVEFSLIVFRIKPKAIVFSVVSDDDLVTYQSILVEVP